MKFNSKPRAKIVLQLSVLLLACLFWPGSLSAHNNNYPFDYDPARAPNPSQTAADLQQLHDRLPGLPEGLVEIVMDGIAFNYYPETLDMIQRARDCGPQIQAPIDRTAHLCAVHAGFTVPAVLIEPASSNCQAAGNEVFAAFAGNYKTCQEVEYPEVYVLDHPPAVVDANFLGRSDLLSTLEGHIALIGEALSHLDFPVGLIPDSFWPTARSVIAKIRYDKLSANIDTRLAAYSSAKQRLQNSASASCFYPGPSANLQSSIDALVAELTAVGQHLDQIYNDGLAQAARDRLAVENQGRLRNDLLHPSLTDHEREMLAFYLTAVYWRMRGGGLIRNPENGSIPDITYVVNLFDLIEQFTGGLYLEGLDSLGYRYALDESQGYQEWWDMGWEDDDQFTDLLWMTDRGRRGVIRPSSTLIELGFDIKHMLAGSLIMGPCYYYMWYELWSRNNRYFQLGEDLVTPYFVFLEMPVSTGEACYGGSMGIGLARTLLWGRPNSSCQPSCSGRACGSDGCGGTCGSCTAPAICSSAGQCFEPGTDAGVNADVSVSQDAATADTTGVDTTGTDTILDDAHMGTDASSSDAGTKPDSFVAADASHADMSSSGDVNDVDSQGCDGCSALNFGNSQASFLLFYVMFFAAFRRRR